MRMSGSVNAFCSGGLTSVKVELNNPKAASMLLNFLRRRGGGSLIKPIVEFKAREGELKGYKSLSSSGLVIIQV